MKNTYKKIAYFFFVCILIQNLNANSNLMRSLILPGWGELKMEETKRSRVLMTADLSIFVTYLLGKNFNASYIDQYKAYGSLYADADMTGKDYSYIVNMSNYNSMDEYNQDMSNRKNYDDMYEDSNYNWEWDSKRKRLNFNDMRESSIVSEKFAEFAVAGLIINRVISAIDILYLTNKNSNVKLNAFVLPEKNEGMSLNLSFSLK